MKVKTSELTGAALDWAVAKCAGHQIHHNALLDGRQAQGFYIAGLFQDPNVWLEFPKHYKPSERWAQGGPIIEREQIAVVPLAEGWEAQFEPGCLGIERMCVSSGPTPLIAAMRCYVASKLGDEVEIPDELL